MKRGATGQIALGILLAASPPLAGQTPGLPSRVTIDSNYPSKITFQVSLFGKDSIQTQGKVPSNFRPRQETYSGNVNIWLAGMDGKYRIYGSKGELEEKITARCKTITKPVRTGGTIEFDALGYPKKSPSDPADLIPIFPSKPVAVGDHWTAKAWVAEPLGQGEAQYSYTVEAISVAENGDILASIRFSVSAHLAPPRSLPGWSSTLTGSGHLDWDCNAHQRTATSYQLAYSARRDAASITETHELTERVTQIH
jgi:hypothetical protein